MAKITFIVPVHEFNDTVAGLIKNALQSIKETKYKEQAITLVGPESVLKDVEPIVNSLKMKSTVNYLYNSGETDFFSQVNYAVLHCTSKYFCVVEFDDTVMEIWPANAIKYQEFSSASVVMPLCEFVKNGEMVSFGNELAWDGSFSNDIGFLDIDCFNTYVDFNVTGALIKTEDFLSVGGLKPSLKFAAWYEFLLRICHNGYKVYVAPKLGYSHTIMRDGSYMVKANAEISKDEGTWLLETAKQEYFFKEDRKKKYGD